MSQTGQSCSTNSAVVSCAVRFAEPDGLGDVGGKYARHVNISGGDAKTERAFDGAAIAPSCCPRIVLILMIFPECCEMCSERSALFSLFSNVEGSVLGNQSMRRSVQTTHQSMRCVQNFRSQIRKLYRMSKNHKSCYRHPGRPIPLLLP